jgi:hypothetical protein
MLVHILSTIASSIDLRPLPTAKDGIFETVLGIVIGITAAISFLFIVIGGFRYVISQGDPQAIAKAKGTIVYALVGLIIAASAQAIVVFVLRRSS